MTEVAFATTVVTIPDGIGMTVRVGCNPSMI